MSIPEQLDRFDHPAQRSATRVGARRATSAAVLLSVAAGVLTGLSGCEVDSFFDPSKTGSFSTTPSTMPVLTRLDVIESDTATWRNASPPTAEDLLPSDLFYRLAPGDLIRVDIFELQASGQTTAVQRTVDQAGMIRLPTIGDLRAAGLTPQELEESIILQLRTIIDQPQVTVSLEQERNLLFTVMGRIAGAGPYRLTRPDLRLLEALAIAGGLPETTDRIYIVRRVPLDDVVSVPWDRSGASAPAQREPAAPLDIEALIRELEGRQPTAPDADGAAAPGVAPPAGAAGAPDRAPDRASDAGAGIGASTDRRSPTAPPSGDRGLVDIDDLDPRTDPIRVSGQPSTATSRASAATPALRGAGDSFVFDRASNSWTRVPAASSGGASAGSGAGGQDILDAVEGAGQRQGPGSAGTPLFAERVIEIEYKTLISGDSAVNVVVRPGDLIYVQAKDFGFVYVEGEILRPGVYELPVTGGLTLSRLVAAAGGLGPIAIPERVDLTRTIGTNREATIRVNLAAIRRRTEPDILIRAGDHVIVGTNFWALPLAVARNGFRVTYGFGFLLDRNFGNDVFGAPPTNIGG